MNITALTETAPLPRPPRADPRPTSAVRHGITLTDEFAWLRDPRWRAVMRDPSLLDPDIRAYLEAENAYAETALAPTVPLQDALFAEMRGRIKEDDAGVPAADGPFAYFSRHREGGQHPLICREPRAGGLAETLLDGDALAAGKSFFRVGATAH
jgi:oligopeptidase B